jgi:DNA-binding transcriptional LysR family regulator
MLHRQACKTCYVENITKENIVMTFPFTLRQLEYFDAVASEGSLSAAAERCHVSATALALALDELEKNVKVQLLVRRKGRGVILTPAGAMLLRHAQQLLSGAETFVEEASQNAKGLRGRLMIGCYPTLAPFFLPAAIERFGGKHPELELEFEEAAAPDLHDMLLRGRIDLAILYGVDVSKQLEFDPIREYQPYVIVAQGHRLAGRGAVKLAELVSEPLIQMDMQPSRQNTEHIFASFGLRPIIRYTTTNYELARCLVGRGLGYSILVQRLAPKLTYDGHRVELLEIADKLAPTVVGLARPRGAPRTAKYLALRSFLSTLEQASAAPG